MSETRNKEKIECFEEYMKGDHALVHLDARKPGVELPNEHHGNPALTLKLSYFFRGETTHDNQKIESFLKFHGEYCRCILPWSAVWGITSSNGENQLWPQDMPKELLAQAARAKVKEVGKKLFGKLGKASEATPVVSPAVAEKNVSSVADASGATRKRPTPNLKRVK